MKRMYFFMMLFLLISPALISADSKNTYKSGKGLSLPYTCNFETLEIFQTWTIVDVNADGKTWMGVPHVTPPTARCSGLGKNGMNDWLMSPAITLEGGKKYRLSFNTQATSGYKTESLKVFYGKGVTVEDQTNLLCDYPAVKFGYVNESVAICPSETGDYNIGFYGYSTGATYFLDVTNVRVEEMEKNDMQALFFSGQTMPKINKEYTYKVIVKNNASVTQSSYKVQLIDQTGAILATTNVTEPIETYEIKEIIVKWTPTVVGKIQAKAKVVLENDQLSSNDETKAIEINVQPDDDDEWAVVGDGTKKESSPIDFFYKHSASQVLYLADEIGFTGMINKLIYSYTNEKGHKVENRPIKIYMASTSLTDLSAGLIPESKMTLVFDGTVSMTKTEGELEIDLTSPFVHSEGNLIITTLHSFTKNSYYDMFRFLSTENASTAKRTLKYANSVNAFDWTKASILNSVANVKIRATTAGEGGKIEGVVTTTGAGLEGVKISLSPNNISTITDEAGKYSFGFVPAGDYTLTAHKYAFEKVIRTGISPVSYQPIVVDIEMTMLSKNIVTGTVIDKDNKKIEGANISIDGYAAYTATTDVNGDFTIEDVYKDNGYTIEVEKKGYATYSNSFDVVDENTKLNITLSDEANPPLMVSATASATQVDIIWNQPGESQTFRHDDGQVVGQLGFGTGSIFLENGVVGSAYRTPAVLNSMSWWTVGSAAAGGPHETINVFVMELDNKGVPTSQVIFNQMNVPNRDDQWTTFNFPYPIECPNGFLVGISYIGFVGIGHDAGTSTEWPFEPNANYGTVNYKLTPFHENVGSGTVNLMIRAEGYKVDESKSLQGYKIWRLTEANQTDESKWTLLTTEPIKTKAYTDNSWTSASTGTYKYAIKAIYTGGIESTPYLSNMVSKGMTSAVTITVKTNTTTNESTGATVKLTNKDNKAEHIYTSTVTEGGKVVIPNVWKGSYTIEIPLAGFATMEEKDVEINTETFTSEYTLRELTVTPYNLVITKNDKESERSFNWNQGNMEDDFERHDDFKINSPGGIGWNYIDKDKLGTLLLKSYRFTGEGSPMAYIVFNPSATTPPVDFGAFPEFIPHSGNKYLASFPVTEQAPLPCEDFFISPELSFSRDFTFSFWAAGGLDPMTLASMRVGYSTSGKEESDFKKWLTPGKSINTKYAEWTKYSYTVPSEAKYVTIECVSFHAGTFMIDDVFIGIEPSKAMSKYEIYLDGEKVAEESNSYYKFTDLTNGKHTAGVKAIYSSGATEISAIEFEVNLVGVEDVNTISLNIYPNPVKDMLNIEGEYQSLEIYNAAGKTVLTANGEAQINVSNLSQGIYIIKARNGNKVGTFKIVK